MEKIKRVAKIEILPDENPVYDFQVADNNNFFANDTLVHNCDELDTLSGEGKRAIKEVSGMLDTKKGKKPLLVGISTRKTKYGLMNAMIDNAEKEGRHLRFWTALEFTERCPDDRSGTIPTQYWLNQDTGQALSPQEYEALPKNKQQGFLFEPEGMFDKCKQCPAAVFCRGDAKKQTSTSPMLKTISEHIQKVRREGIDWAAAQLYNLKPSSDGLVFPEFDPAQHTKSWNDMWLTLTGKEFPGNCTHDIFVKKCFSDDTEVLTANGFKLFQDLTPYDTIASTNEEGKLIYEQPLDYISYRYKGNAFNLYNKIGGHNKQLDMLMTEGHDQVYFSKKSVLSGRYLPKKVKIEDADKLRDFYVMAAPVPSNRESKLISPISFMDNQQFLSFMGIWLSEGSISSPNSRNKMWFVSQKKVENIEHIDNLMSSIRWPLKLRRSVDPRDGAVTWSSTSLELFNYLSRWRYAPNKAIDRYIIDNASNDELSTLIHWLMMGDGSEYSKDTRQQPYYGTGSKQLANDVQEVATILGYRTNLTSKYSRPHKQRRDGTHYIPMYRVQIHSKNFRESKRYWYINNSANVSEYSGKSSSNIDKTTYDGMVYCVTMPSGRLFVRRNGVIALSGNCHDLKLPVYAGVDWGFSNPNTVVYFAVDPRENIYIFRVDAMTHVSQPTWIHHMKTKYHLAYRCQLYFPDTADQGAVQEMQKAGLPVSNSPKGEINTGIQVIKKFLRTPGSNQPRLFIAKETAIFMINEFQVYHFKTNAAGEVTDTPEGESDHSLDALRYALTQLFGRNNIILGSGLDITESNNSNIIDGSGAYLKPPTPQEFAAINNIDVSNSDLINSKLGKIGKASDIDSEDDDDGSGGNGSFVWSF